MCQDITSIQHHSRLTTQLNSTLSGDVRVYNTEKRCTGKGGCSATLSLWQPAELHYSLTLTLLSTTAAALHSVHNSRCTQVCWQARNTLKRNSQVTCSRLQNCSHKSTRDVATTCVFTMNCMVQTHKGTRACSESAETSLNQQQHTHDSGAKLPSIAVASCTRHKPTAGRIAA